MNISHSTFHIATFLVSVNFRSNITTILRLFISSNSIRDMATNIYIVPLTNINEQVMKEFLLGLPFSLFEAKWTESIQSHVKFASAVWLMDSFDLTWSSCCHSFFLFLMSYQNAVAALFCRYQILLHQNMIYARMTLRNWKSSSWSSHLQSMEIELI